MHHEKPAMRKRDVFVFARLSCAPTVLRVSDNRDREDK